MFIALDESIGKQYVVIGCLCCPLDKIPQLEKEFHKLRIDLKCWGELDWSGLSKEYLERYIKFTEIFLKEKDITFHSWAYKRPTSVELKIYFNGDYNSVIHKHEFSLLKNTLRKFVNSGINNFYVVLDKFSGGFKEYIKTKEFLLKSEQIHPKPIINFYSPIDSKISSIMQISSLCTSAVRHKYEEELNEDNKEIKNQYIKFLESTNSNIDINFSPRVLPQLSSYKFHHCLWKPVLAS